MACLPFNNLMVQDLTEKGPVPLECWNIIPTDLNSGVGGDFIYVGYQTGDDNPITSITFKSYSQSQKTNPMPEWQWYPCDLNNGAGGDYIYMFWMQNEKDKDPITNLMFLVIEQSEPPIISGYTSIKEDLNNGAGGPYIFAYYSQTICPDEVTKVMRKKIG